MIFAATIGQWGHLQQIDQTPAQAPKWAYVKDYYDEFAAINPLASQTSPISFLPVSPPAASPDGTLLVQWGAPFNITFPISNAVPGSVQYTTIADVNTAGLAASGPLLFGCPTAVGLAYHFLRAVDSAGNGAWHDYQLQIYGAPGSLVETEFWSAANPGLVHPWTGVLYVDGARLGQYSGISEGPATRGQAG